MRNAVRTFTLTILLGTAAQAHAGFIAYQARDGTDGNQGFPLGLGMDFSVGSAGITVTSLGAFDDDGNGIIGTITVQIYNLAGGGPLLTETFTGSSDPLLAGHRMRALGAPLNLTSGNYTIVGYGYSTAEENFNRGVGSTTGLSTDDGGGLIKFIGRARFGGLPGSGPPTFIDGGPADRYRAGTFEFKAIQPVPEPSSLTLLGIGAISLLCYGRKVHLLPDRRRNQA
jgi:hypothetical protein